MQEAGANPSKCQGKPGGIGNGTHCIQAFQHGKGCPTDHARQESIAGGQVFIPEHQDCQGFKQFLQQRSDEAQYHQDAGNHSRLVEQVDQLRLDFHWVCQLLKLGAEVPELVQQIGLGGNPETPSNQQCQQQDQLCNQRQGHGNCQAETAQFPGAVGRNRQPARPGTEEPGKRQQNQYK